MVMVVAVVAFCHGGYRGDYDVEEDVVLDDDDDRGDDAFDQCVLALRMFITVQCVQ